MHSRQLEYRKTAAIKPHPKNARTHPRKQIERLAVSIREFGFTNPILVDEAGVILAGHARWQAAKDVGLKTVPIIVLRGLSEARKRAYVLADNKIAELAGYDRSALAAELEELSSLLAADDLDLSLTGFDPAEIDGLFSDFIDPEADPADDVPEIKAAPVSRKGDLWVMGERHRLLCDDARQSDYGRLMRGDQAGMGFSDPPYNVSIPKTVGRGRVKHRNFAMAAGEMSAAVFAKFLTEVLSAAAAVSVDGALHYICMDWRHIREMQDAGNAVYSELKNLVVWAKTNAGQGALYRSQHELIFVYKVGEGSHLNNIELGRHGRNRSNVWTYAGANTFRAGRMADLAAHPTVKPVALVADAIRDASRRGDIVLDPFMGVGTTILAAERIGRRAYGIEIDPLYVDAAIRRWQAVTKRDAVLEGTGQTFDEIAAKSPRRSRRAK
jgi:DNA modification methylase